MTFDWRFFFTIVLLGLAMASAISALFRLYKIMRIGKNEILWKDEGKRLALFTRNVLGQGKLFKDFWPGLQHAIIFWGFIVITVGTTEAILDGLFHGFTMDKLLGESLAEGIAVMRDFLHPVVLVAVAYGFYRRLVIKPKRLASDWEHTKDAILVLSLTGGLMLANMISEGGFVLAGAEPHMVSHQMAHLMMAFGAQQAQGMAIGHVGWALHLAIVCFFMAYIPHSKHLHILAAGPNIFFSRLKHRGTFSKVNFEDETQTSFGAGKLTELSWKDILDSYSCTSCGRCNVFCPTATTDKPLRPMKLIEDLKHLTLATGDAYVRDRNVEPPVPLIGEKSGITEDTLWACTTCKACVEACPVMIDHVDKIVDMRRHLVLMQGAMPAELQTTMANWERQSNPWGFSPDLRDEWAKDLKVARYSEKPSAEYLFYVGCAGSFNDRNKKISTSFVKILQAAGVDFAILGKEELCNGETARRAGNEYLAKTMIDANVEVLKRYNVKKILTTCPHCFNTLKNEYPDFGFTAEEVIHHTEFIDRLQRDGRISMKNTGDKSRVAFHDSCYLGRYNEVYEAPRSALKAVPGVELVEMPRNKTTGLCCGAGGARMWMEEKIGKRINVERTEEALTLKPDVIAAGCPYCQVMINDGVTEKGVQETVKVLDVAEIVADRL